MADDLQITLIHLLNLVNNLDSIPVSNNFFDTEHPLIQAIKFIAEQYLIDEDGHPNRKNIDVIGSYGFIILPGEMDRFGWITGIICLNRGNILFG